MFQKNLKLENNSEQVQEFEKYSKRNRKEFENYYQIISNLNCSRNIQQWWVIFKLFTKGLKSNFKHKMIPKEFEKS